MTDTPHDDELIAFERQVAHLRGQNPTVAVELVLDRCTTLYEQHDADQQQIAELRATAHILADRAQQYLDENTELRAIVALMAGQIEHSMSLSEWAGADLDLPQRVRAWLASHPR